MLTVPLYHVKMTAIPEKTENINFEQGGFQNAGTMPDMRSIYDETDPGRKFAVSKPVIFTDYVAHHLQIDFVHSSRLQWIKNNESDFVRAIENPEFVEKKLRSRNDGFYSATHIVKVQHPTSRSNTYMAVAISLSKDIYAPGTYHQITTIHPLAERDVIKSNGEIKPKYVKIQ